MKIHRIEEMTSGWFIGNFAPAAFKTDQFEVGYKLHPAGEKWDAHSQRKNDHPRSRTQKRRCLRHQ